MSYRVEFLIHRGAGPHRCHFCGNDVAYEDGGRKHDHSLVVHHVDHDRSNCDQENLVPAHAWCHRHYHATQRRPRSAEPSIRRFYVADLGDATSRRIVVSGRPCEIGETLLLRDLSGDEAWFEVIEAHGPRDVVVARADSDA